VSATRQRSFAGLLTIGLGASIAPLDFAVNVAFPAITAALALEVQSIRWVVICYVASYASLMLAFGKLGDVAGHHRVFRAGLIVGALAFAACALAPAYPWLLAARMAQGVATALVLSCAPALVVSVCGEHQRTWALSRYAMMGALASILGPLIGGLSIELLGWPGVFWFRVPVALLTLALLARLPEAPASAGPPRTFDIMASVLLTAGLALLLSATALWPGSADTVWPLAAALGGSTLLAAFALRERGCAEPVLPPAALRNRAVLTSNLASIMVHFTGFAIPLLVPYYLARIGGFGATAMGLLLAIAAVGVLAGSAAAPRLVQALGQRSAALLGMALVALAQLAIALWPLAPATAALATALLLHGAGIGVFQVSYSDLILATLPQRDRGVAGSLTMLTRTIGVIVSAIVLSSALQAAEARHLAEGRTPAGAFHAAFATVFWCSGLALTGFLVISSVLAPGWRRRRSGNPPR
jgi:MFS family permease